MFLLTNRGLKKLHYTFYIIELIRIVASGILLKAETDATEIYIHYIDISIKIYLYNIPYQIQKLFLLYPAAV